MADVSTLARLTGVAALALASLTGASAAYAASGEAGATPLVVGGQDADIADHPFAVALVTLDGQQFCGGSLVAPNKVLTAAHCTDGSQPEEINVVSGRTELSSQEGAVTAVTDIWVHPQYQTPTAGYDVSVLTLESSVEQSPIELAGPDDPGYQPGGEATVLGWGLTSEGGSPSDHLQRATVPVVSDSDCSDAYQEYSPDSMVCAGYPEGGVDACQGDSGGPLVVDGKLVGVTSWGNGCARPGYPGVYARVGAYYDDLVEQINATGGGLSS